SFIVQIKQDFLPSEVAGRVAKAFNMRTRHIYRVAVRGFSIEAGTNIKIEDILSIPGVLYVEHDREVRITEQVIPTGIRRIRAHESSIANIDGVDVDIVIIDTGIDRNHPDLNVVAGRNFTSDDPSAWDDGNGHGTHVAGIAAALDNDIGVVGVAPGARLWAVKVLGASGSGSLSDLIAGVDWVTQNADEIAVANMSLGLYARSRSLRTAIQNSVAAGVVYFAAAGNDSRDVYGADGVFGTRDDFIPAAYPEVAAISALADSDGEPGSLGPDTSKDYGKDDSFASFSNYSRSVAADNPVNSPGAAIDLLMPGVDIYSTYKNMGYATLSGTSMSSPHAAGLAALYIAAHGRATSAAEVYAIRQALIDMGMDQATGNRLAHPETEPDTNPENLGWARSFIGNPPEVFWAYPEDGDVISGDAVNMQIDASDEEDTEGTLVVEWRVDGRGWEDAEYEPSSGYYEALWDTTTLPDGVYNLHARATDSDDNRVVSRIGVAVDNIDDAPVAFWIKPEQWDILQDTVDIKIQASDDRDKGDELVVEWRVDGGDWEDAEYEPSSGYYEAILDTKALSDGTYTLQARATDRGDNVSSLATITVYIKNQEELKSILYQNYPNPFDLQTTIKFYLATPAHVILKIYNMQGQLVKTLVDEYRGADNHSEIWNADNDAGNKVASGVYFYQIRAGIFVSMKKMLLMK
ncbi:S8 family serine peptidase, partial [Candidatus Aerophobetes bacterium]|nr:S8 family serine peptidase [Candidatus Aerophobetes bacterium]